MVTLDPLGVQDSKPGDAGRDLATATNFILWPHQTRSIHTGLRVEVPVGCFGYIKERSSVGKRSVITLAGIIDASYRGELIILLHNLGHWPRFFERGQRIAQIVIMPIIEPRYREVFELRDTWRGAKGFGEGTGT